MARGPARPACHAADVGRRLVLGPRVARTAEDRLLPRRISRSHLDDIHDMAIKAALKDQETAGIDIVSDGELRRDNDIDYFLARMPGVQIPSPSSRSTTTTTTPSWSIRCRPTDSAAGPGRRPPLHPAVYRPPGQVLVHRTVLAVAPDTEQGLRQVRRSGPGARQVLNAEARALAEAGAKLLQIDEPFLAGYPEDVGVGGQGDQHRDPRRRRPMGLHVCYGNRYARPSWEGPLRLSVPCRARREGGSAHPRIWPQGLRGPAHDPAARLGPALGLGVMDVKTEQIEIRGSDRCAHPQGAGHFPGREIDHQPRLRAAAPSRRCRQSEAGGDGGRAPSRVRRTLPAALSQEPLSQQPPGLGTDRRARSVIS